MLHLPSDGRSRLRRLCCRLGPRRVCGLLDLVLGGLLGLCQTVLKPELGRGGCLSDRLLGRLSRGGCRLCGFSAEADGEQIWINSTGFSTKGMTAGTYSYIAIRRGPMLPPTDGTDVFSIDTFNSATLSSVDPSFTSNDHIVDFAINKITDLSYVGFKAQWRISGYREIQPSDKNEVNQNASGADFRYNNGYFRDGAGADNDYYAWMWRRQHGFCDQTMYTGTSSNQTITNNLGVEPEMIWIKSWDTSYDWNVYHKDLGTSSYLFLNSTTAAVNNQTGYYQSTPTATSFTLGTYGDVNANTKQFAAFLFASVPGVSKVG